MFLFVSVIWMVWDDYDREWKNTQRHFVQLEYQVTQAQLQSATRSIDRNKLQQLESQEAAAQKNIRANQAKVDDLGNQLVWQTRIFEDRQRVIKFVCEVPTAIDQRLFALGRTIQQEIE